jgi:hypothetical protein
MMKEIRGGQYAHSISLSRKRSEVIDFYGFKNAGLSLSHLWEREPRRGGRGRSCWEKHPLPNPHQWEREQTQVCSVLFPGQKSVAPWVHDS